MAGSFQNLSSSHKEASSVQVRSLAADWGLGRDMEGRDTDGWDAVCCDQDWSGLLGCCVCFLRYWSRISWEGSLPWTSVKSTTAILAASSQCCLDCGE
eukprot:5586540-Ditylum_brightwellii.AAC.1